MELETSTTVTISTLNRGISEAMEKLAPATERDVAGFLRSLMAAGLVPALIEPENVVKVYGYALDGRSRHCIETVTKKLIRGEYEQHGAFLPKPPEMARLVREQEAFIRAGLYHQRERLKTCREAAERLAKPPRSEESKQRVRDLVASVVRNADVSGEDGRHGC